MALFIPPTLKHTVQEKVRLCPLFPLSLECRLKLLPYIPHHHQRSVNIKVCQLYIVRFQVKNTSNYIICEGSWSFRSWYSHKMLKESNWTSHFNNVQCTEVACCLSVQNRLNAKTFLTVFVLHQIKMALQVTVSQL